MVWSLAAHAAFFPRFKSISPDFPGMVRKMLQSKYGDQLTVIYLPGFAGSGIPNYKAKIFPKLRLEHLFHGFFHLSHLFHLIHD